MKKVKYRLADGKIIELKISNQLKTALDSIYRQEKLSNRRETRRHQSLDVLLDNDDFLIVDSEPSPYDIYVAEDATAHPPEYISILTNRQRKIYNMHYVDNLSMAQIAKELNIGKSTVQESVMKSNEKILKHLNLSDTD